MRRAVIGSLCLSMIATGYVAPIASAAPPSYTVVDLGVLDYGVAYGLNETPLVVGHAETPSVTFEAARWDAGVLTQLPSLNNAGGTLARAVNEGGLVVGESYDGLGGLHAVTWSGATIADLGTLVGNSSTAFAVNDSGAVVGEGQGDLAGHTHALLWDGGGPIDLGVLPGGDNSHARGINASGAIVGDSEIEPGGHFHAALWQSGVATDLGTLPGDTLSNAVAINALGHATGRSFGRPSGGQFAFMWDGSSMTELPMLPGGVSLLEAHAMNDADQIVGRGDRFAAYQSAFLWEAATGVTLDLQTLLPGGSGWQLQDAFAINNAGQIAGYGFHGGQLHAFLMTPGSGPAPTDVVVATLQPGGTASTDSGPPGATAGDPMATTVTVPIAGVVTILEGVGSSGAPGFTVIGQPITISGPYSDASNPLQITFVFDASIIPAGQDETTIQVFRDSDLALPCVGAVIADPDPCVLARQLLGDGDVQITVLSSHASLWIGAVSDTPAFPFRGFFAPVDNPSTLNVVKAGSSVPLKFSLGGDRGLNILAPGSPDSRIVACDQTARTDQLEHARGAVSGGLSYNARTQVYTYVWTTLKSWRGCREVVLTLSDGTEHRALFSFRR